LDPFFEDGRLRALWRLGIQYAAYWVLVQLYFYLFVVAWLLAAGRNVSGGLDGSVASLSPHSRCSVA